MDCDCVRLDWEVGADDPDGPCAQELDASSEFSKVGDAGAIDLALAEVDAILAASAALSLILHTLLERGSCAACCCIAVSVAAQCSSVAVAAVLTSDGADALDFLGPVLVDACRGVG